MLLLNEEVKGNVIASEHTGWIVDLFARTTFRGRVRVQDGKIESIVHDESVEGTAYILPGFVDAHVHIESSLLVPSEFARMAVLHGTVATVSDPHEIANVCGMDGVQYMLNNAASVPFTFAFGAPSCVPATTFETAGAEISVADVEALLRMDQIYYLSEMMNWPGVLHDDTVVLEKLRLARHYQKPADGHAPGLRGDAAKKYAGHGITTDHECFTLEEATDKLAAGMKIIIREGSAAKNFEALHPIIGTHPDKVLFCCDDAHPDMLKEGHINKHVQRAIALGYNVYDVLRAASVHPVEHYRLPVGLLRVNDSADFIVVDNLTEMNVRETWIRGIKVADNGTTLLPSVQAPLINKFTCAPLSVNDVYAPTQCLVRVIVAHDGQLITTEEHAQTSDPDVLKLCVVNRYRKAPVAVGWIKGFGLGTGALASSVAHDSHNIVAVGATDEELVAAINAVIEHRGGLSVAMGAEVRVLPLPVAGLMSNGDAWSVAEEYTRLDAAAKQLGSRLKAPFMTLSFMALLVIPELKLSDKGLFDGRTFSFVPVSLS